VNFVNFPHVCLHENSSPLTGCIISDRTVPFSGVICPFLTLGDEAEQPLGSLAALLFYDF
jgi:hypothetical protein